MSNLLEKVLSDGDEGKIFKNYTGLKPLTKLDCTKAVLWVTIHILNEDLRCWIHQLSCATQPADLLRSRVNWPLVAHMLWPTGTIGRITGPCRQLIDFHLKALVGAAHSHVLFVLFFH